MQSHRQHKCTFSLPPEVWICIFHHATDVPGTLIPDIYTHATLIGPVYNKRYHAELRKALITKRALVRVCKKWWYLAIPFLYQSVYIGRARCLQSLSRTLADSATGKGTMVCTRPLGEYTQRLDIAVRDHCVDPDAESGYLTRIIRHMRYLAIAVFAPTTWYIGHTDIVDSIVDALHHSAPSLRILDWSIRRIQLSDRQVMDLLAKCTQLRILYISYSIWSRVLRYDGIPATVSTLHLQKVFHLPQSSGLNTVHRSICSAIRELSLDFRLSHSDREDLLRVYGPQLVSVHLCIYHMIEPDMKLLAETCPNLRRLTITSTFDFNLVGAGFVFPSVGYLGLNTSWNQSKKRDFKNLFVTLGYLMSRSPSLRVVRFLNESNVECMLNSHTKITVRALQSFETTPLRIEDRDGVLLTDRLRALGHL